MSVTGQRTLVEPTREQQDAIEKIALAAGRVRVEQLAGGNVMLTVIINPDGEAVETSEDS